jgi:hypothetical protein
MNNTIKLYLNYGDIYLVSDSHIACYLSTYEAAEVLHDIMRSANKLESFLALYDTVEREEEEMEETLESAELILEISLGIGRISTLDVLIGELQHKLGRTQSRHEETVAELVFRLLCEAYDDDAHVVTSIPACWLSWLYNADATGLTDSEWQDARDWEQEHDIMAHEPCDNVYGDVTVLAYLKN